MERLTKETLKRIRKVQLKMDRVATDLLAGMYRSAFKGKGMEFEEVREFQPGDEKRSVDWNVTARMGTPFIKLFREERELTVILMVDISASTRFGSVHQLKSTVLSEIGAVLAFSGIKNQDKIGLLLFTDRVEHYLPPAKGIRHVLRLIRDLIGFTPIGKGTQLNQALDFLGKVEKKHAVVFLLSDFLEELHESHPIQVIGKKHDLIALAIQDPREQMFPPLGLMQVGDLESGYLELIDTEDPSFNTGLQDEHQKRLRFFRQLIEKSGGSWIDISTDKAYLHPLKKFFLQRGRK